MKKLILLLIGIIIVSGCVNTVPVNDIDDDSEPSFTDQSFDNCITKCEDVVSLSGECDSIGKDSSLSLSQRMCNLDTMADRCTCMKDEYRKTIDCTIQYRTDLVNDCGIISEEYIDVEQLTRECESAGGEVKTSLCCKGTLDFPNMCVIGPCGCSPDNSHEITICECEEGQCFNGEECVDMPR
jgi:hypothetical protein